MFKFNNFFNKNSAKYFLFASTTLFLGSQFTYKKYKLSTEEIYNKNLPFYSRRVVMDHSTPENRIWVTYKGGVYDVTDWVAVHPGGGDKIMMVAGGAIDPFWEMYQFHKKEEILEILEKFRIGNLNEEDILKDIPNFDNLRKEVITRSPYLTRLLGFPYCAECPPDKILRYFYTPEEYFFVRNHNSVPMNLSKEDYKIKIINTLSGNKLKVNLNDLKNKYETKQVETIMMCTGNRRSQMNKPQPAKGLAWTTGAIANGIWEGVLVRDILSKLGFNKENSKGLHLIVNGLDKDLQGTYYSISVPLEVAMSEETDVILAYFYNGGEIPYEHGYPLRFIIPGYVGVRNVKWIKSIEISDNESTGAFQQRDYKIIPKDVDWEKADVSKLPPLMKHVINSVIVEPLDNSIVSKDIDNLIIKGWAIGTFGSKLKNIELSFDEGISWHQVDNLKFNQNEIGKVFGWTIWEYSINKNNPLFHQGNFDIWVRSQDEDGNIQPINCEDIWNHRGLMNNSIHKVKINIL